MTTKQKLLDFDNLAFITMYQGTLAEKVVAQLNFGDFKISVIANSGDGHGIYGDFENNQFEVAMYFKGVIIPLSPCGDIVGWQSPNQVSHLMKKAQIEGSVWVDELIAEKEEDRKDLGLDY